MQELYDKFQIRDKDGKPVEERCLVLKPESDPDALEALRTYAYCTRNVKLQRDLFRWIDEIESKIEDKVESSGY